MERKVYIGPDDTVTVIPVETLPTTTIVERIRKEWAKLPPFNFKKFDEEIERFFTDKLSYRMELYIHVCPRNIVSSMRGGVECPFMVMDRINTNTLMEWHEILVNPRDMNDIREHLEDNGFFVWSSGQHILESNDYYKVTIN